MAPPENDHPKENEAENDQYDSAIDPPANRQTGGGLSSRHTP
jgi:hypothetical protein